MSGKKVTTIGSAVVDIYFQSESFIPKNLKQQTLLCQPYGDKIEIDNYQLATGGAATNVAVALAKRGHEVSIIAEVGQDAFGQSIKTELELNQVDLSKLIVEKDEQTGISVALRGTDGRRTIMVSRSAASMLDHNDIPVGYLLTRDWIHLSSVAGNLTALSQIWKVFDRSETGLSWNPGVKELQLLNQGALSLPQPVTGIFFVNETEWAMVENIQDRILELFQIVVVTAGKAGGTVYVDGAKYRQFKGSGKPAVEETGAGDAFASAFVSTFLYDCTIDEAITAGLNNAESVIKYVGAKQGLLAY